MAKDSIKWGADDTPAPVIKWGEADRPAAQRDLPTDVAPSEAGGGRGSVQPEPVRPSDAPEPDRGPVPEGDALARVTPSIPGSADVTFTTSAPPEAGAGRGLVNPPLVNEPAPPQSSGSLAKDLAINTFGGAAGGLAGAGATLAEAAAAKDTAANLDQIRQNWQGVQKESGGDTIPGRAASLVGAVAPVFLVPAVKAAQLVANAGLFAIPAFRDTLKSQLDEGKSFPLALAHASEDFGINLFLPTVATRGSGAVVKALQGAETTGVKGAATALGQAAGEGAAFSAASSATHKATDELAGEPNDKGWVDLGDMASSALGFSVLRGAHLAPQAASAVADRLGSPSRQIGRALGQDVASTQITPDHIQRLRAAGEDEAADLLERQATASAVSNELRAMGDDASSPGFQQAYRQQRLQGTKPAAAAARAGMGSSFDSLAASAGLPPKAVAAAQEQAAKLPLDQVPGFLDRFVSALTGKGLGQPLPPAAVDTTLSAARDKAMGVALKTVYSDDPAAMLNAIKRAAEPVDAGKSASDAQDASAVSENPPPVAENQPSVSREAPFDAGHDIIVTPEAEKAHQAATSPLNDVPEPTQAQKDAGNYKVGRLRVAGMDISVENPQGSVRRGVGADGKAWETPMQDHYGYIRGTVGADKDHLDVFVKPGTPDDFKGPAFVVDQIDPATGKFDEAKVVLGAADRGEAEQVYRRNYGANWQGLGAITELPMPAFKAWARSDHTKEPLGDISQSKIANAEATTGPEGNSTAALPSGTRDASASSEQRAAPDEIPAGDGKAAEVQPRADGVAGPDSQTKQPDAALNEPSAAQLAARAKAAARLALPSTSPNGEPIPAHAFIAAEGGLRREEMPDAGFDRNLRVGNRTLFAAQGKGMTIERATEKLIESGYLPTGSLHNAAYDLIRTSVRHPQYTPDGWQRIAEAQAHTRFEDHLAAQRESEADPFAPLSKEDLAASGAEELTPAEREAFAAEIAAAQHDGIDTEAILERAAQITENGTEHDYHQAAVTDLQAARASRRPAAEGARPEQGRGNAQPESPSGRGSVSGEQGAARGEGVSGTAADRVPIAGGPAADARARPAAPGGREASAGLVDSSGITWEPRPSGTLAVHGDPETLRKLLADNGISRVMLGKDGVLVGKTEADRAEKFLSKREPKAKAEAPSQPAKVEGLRQDGDVGQFRNRQIAQQYLDNAKSDVHAPQETPEQRKARIALRKSVAGTKVTPLSDGTFVLRKTQRAAGPLSVGLSEAEAEPVTVKDGVIHIGRAEAINFETGDPVKVAPGATDAQIKQALKDAGTLSKRQKFYGGEADESKPIQPAPEKAPASQNGKTEGKVVETGREASAADNGLTTPSKEDVLAQQQRAQEGDAAEAKAKQDEAVRAQADAERGDFTLTGSDRAADSNPGQGAMFKRDGFNATGPALKVGQIRTVLGPALRRLAIPHAVHSSIGEAEADSGFKGIPAGAKGMHFNGKLHLIAEGIRSPLEAEHIFWHEVNHAGLHAMYGTRSLKYENALRDLSAQNSNIRQGAKAWMTKYGQAEYHAHIDDGATHEEAMLRTKLKAVDEALAELAGRNAKINGVAQFVAKVQEFMRSVGLDRLANWLEGKTNAQALSMILGARAAVMRAPQPERQTQMQPAFSRAEGFNEAVDKAIAAAVEGEKPARDHIEIGHPSVALQAGGIADQPLRTNAGILAKAFFDHGVTRSVLKELPDLLDHPVMVFASDTVPGNFVVVTSRFVGEKPLVVAVSPDQTRGAVGFNFVPSLYPKDRAQAISGWIEKGLLRYEDKKQSPEWFGSFRAPIARGSRPTEGLQDTSIATSKEVGKPPSKDGGGTPSFARSETSSDEAPADTAERKPYTGPGAKLLETTRDAMGRLVNDAFMSTAPMSAGSDAARAVAKDYANADRLARWKWGQFDEVLKKNFTEEQRKKMWEAADEENVLRQTGADTSGKGLERLDPKERAVMDSLHDYGEQLLQRAKDVGMFKGEGLPYWTPRMAVMIGADGEYAKIPGEGKQATSSGAGRNVTTSASSLKRRKYLTAEETEAAASALAQQKGGKGAQLVRDIRTMPMAMARLERAIAGRELIQQIKELGANTGVDTTSTQRGPNFFTLDHPAFQTYRYRPDVKLTEAMDKHLWQGLLDFAHSIGVDPERVASLRGRKWGYASTAGEVVTRFGGPETVLTHELGHQLDFKYGLADMLTKRGVTAKELRALADLRYEGSDASATFKKYVRQGTEKIANMVHAYVHAKDRFSEVAPNTLKAFEQFLDQHPDLADLKKIRASLVLDSEQFRKRPPGEDFDVLPLYVSKDFEGPLKAILSETSGEGYKAMMQLKSKTMGLIMYSPLIHNAVEWGRALPMMPGKVLTFRVYFEGNKIKHDPIQMAQAIRDGMVPIGHRGQVQDITGLAEDPTLAPGRSWTAKLLGGAIGAANAKAGTAVKQGVDAAGDFWHNTLLWDRVGDLQAGLYGNIRSDLINKGMGEDTAGRLAAHFANRYAGALPNEAMSAQARKIANFVLFSRSFTLGNLGVMKDMLTGFPPDIAAQIKRDAGEDVLKAGKSVARRKAIAAFGLDIALLYAGNALLQSAFDKMKRDKSLDEIEQGYLDRFDAMVKRVEENPLDLLAPAIGGGILGGLAGGPVGAAAGAIGGAALSRAPELTPNSGNEPGKEDRIHYGTDDKGTNVYMRLPTGKIGEEFKNWLTSPLQTLLRKQGTIMRPITQTIENDKGFGQRVYNPDDESWAGMAKNMGRIVWNFMSQQVPADAIQSAADWTQGHADETDKMKVLGPLAGLTFSKGAPGGPEVGEMYHEAKIQQGKVADIMPDVRHAIKVGDTDKAIELMESVGMTPGKINSIIRKNEDPASRLSSKALKDYYRNASEESKARMENYGR